VYICQLLLFISRAEREGQPLAIVDVVNYQAWLQHVPGTINDFSVNVKMMSNADERDLMMLDLAEQTEVTFRLT
jgi:hypothetical protein